MLKSTQCCRWSGEQSRVLPSWSLHSATYRIWLVHSRCCDKCWWNKNLVGNIWYCSTSFHSQRTQWKIWEQDKNMGYPYRDLFVNFYSFYNQYFLKVCNVRRIWYKYWIDSIWLNSSISIERLERVCVCIYVHKYVDSTCTFPFYSGTILQYL